jgi:hypothetical protein
MADRRILRAIGRAGHERRPVDLHWQSVGYSIRQYVPL